MQMETLNRTSYMRLGTEGVIPLGQAADEFRARDNERLAYVGLSVAGDHAQVRMVKSSESVVNDLLIPRREEEATVSLFLSCGRATFITGSERLSIFRNRPSDLKTYLKAHMRAVPEQRSHQERLVGKLEWTIACFDGRWVDLAPEGEDGYCVIGCDTQRSRVYAYRRTPDGVCDQLYYAPLLATDRPLMWHYVTHLPERATFLGASRFSGARKNGLLNVIVRMRGENGQPINRLLTLEETGDGPKPLWSDPFTGHLQVVRKYRQRISLEDESPTHQIGLLILEEKQPDQYILRHVPLQQCTAQPLYAYAISSLR